MLLKSTKKQHHFLKKSQKINLKRALKLLDFSLSKAFSSKKREK
jgi:hypothetical protein